MPRHVPIRPLLLAVMLALLGGCAQSPTLSSGACPGSPVAADARDQLNAWRQQAGLGALTMSPALVSAASAHGRYLATHGVNSHRQTPGRAGFTGRQAGDRALAAGYPNRYVAEVLSTYMNESRVSGSGRTLDDLLAGPYHRFLLLDWTRDELGVGCHQREQMAWVYLLGHREAPVAAPEQPPLVVWPPDGAEDIPPVFFAEQPDPLPGHAVSGYPISVQFNPARFPEAPEAVRLQLFEAETGRRLPMIVQRQKSNDPHGLLNDHQFVLFPRERLEWGQTYRAELRYGKDGQHHAWRFRVRERQDPVHRITEVDQIVRPEPGRPFLLQIPPVEGGDAGMSYRLATYPSLKLEAEFVDPQVLRVTARGQGSGEIEFQGHRVRIAL
ncbi:CAP domain-containing protein [Guyparkeria sp. 1SP6A2]|nr:CAP domain-containing protein [Guyparkeria sp. 1SP6A2]